MEIKEFLTKMELDFGVNFETINDFIEYLELL